MHRRILIRLASISIGIALLLAALFFDPGLAGPPAVLQATATPDRLAQPTLPPSPSQADRGAQVYWLSCLPCHGDRGQGLTDEFRQTYPQEEQYCWESGCHGERPYDQGFKLPMKIPALIGPGTLQKFSDAAVLHAYIAAAMPYWQPGSLDEEQTWSVTAYLLRENGVWDGRRELDAAAAAQIRLGAGSTAMPAAPVVPARKPGWPVLAAAGLVTALVLWMLSWMRRKRH